jgi:Tol biopolymer transport system component
MNTKKLRILLVTILGLILVLVSMHGDPALAPVHAATYSGHLLQEGWTDLFQISNQPGMYWESLRISGDGKWVFFQESYNEYLAQSDGSGLHEINLSSHTFPDFSADGTKIAVVSSIYEGGTTRSLAPCVSGGGGSKCLWSDTYASAISGNGRWLFYISDDPWPCEYVEVGEEGYWQYHGNLDGSREVWRIDTTSGDAVQVTDFNTGEDTGPFWVSSDFTGSKIAFTSGADDEVHLYSVNGNGSDLRKLAQVHPGPSSYAHRNIAFISGSGEWIVFTGKGDPYPAVEIIKSDGTGRRLIAANYGCDHGPHGSDCSINYNGSTRVRCWKNFPAKRRRFPTMACK